MTPKRVTVLDKHGTRHYALDCNTEDSMYITPSPLCRRYNAVSTVSVLGAWPEAPSCLWCIRWFVPR